MTELPSFYCCRTLLSYHPGQDLNRITLYGPGDFQFVLMEIDQNRDPTANQTCNRLAAALAELWDNKKAAPEGG